MFLAVLSHSLQEQQLEDGNSRTVLRLPAVLAPTQVAILPLVKKDGLPNLARDLVENLKWDYSTAYDEKDAVGRRYRRQDALGTPYCITVDHQTLEDQTVTLRERDSMEQIRVAIKELPQLLDAKLNLKNWLTQSAKD
jgi:glycyl-tRNA synthetase